MATAAPELTDKQLKMQAFQDYCETSKLPYEEDTLLQYDKEFGTGLLDHKKAKEEGYYYHLRMQARTLIYQFGRQTISLGGSDTISTQDHYVVRDDEGGVERKFTEDFTKEDVAYMVKRFQAEARAKLTRIYLLKNMPLRTIRKMVQKAYEETENRVHEFAKAQRKA